MEAKSKFIDKLIVSTDSMKIINLSKKYDLQFVKRPKKYSTDRSKVHEAVLYTLKKISKNLDQYKYLILLEPTSPLRTHFTIDNCIKHIIDERKKFNYSNSRI